MDSSWLVFVSGLGGVVLGWRLEARTERRWREEDVTREAAIRFLSLGHEMLDSIYAWKRSEHWEALVKRTGVVPTVLKDDGRRIAVLDKEMLLWAVALKQSGRPGTSEIAFDVRRELSDGLLDAWGRLSNGYGVDEDEFVLEYMRASSALTRAVDLLHTPRPLRVRLWRRVTGRVWLWKVRRKRRSEDLESQADEQPIGLETEEHSGT